MDFKELLSPAAVYDREHVLDKPSPVPRAAGVYAWYFDSVPLGVPTVGCHENDAGSLLYVGIAPKEPPSNGGQPSRQTLWNRIRYHYRGNAYGSTLRLTLGCLLADQLGIQLRRVGSGTRLTFATGEAAISSWMAAHAHVAWMTHDQPWEPEGHLFHALTLPLNLQGNSHSPFAAQLSAIRAAQRLTARSLPVV